MKCKTYKYFKIEKPDKLNEGYAYCLKHNLITALFPNTNWKHKINKLECEGNTRNYD